MISYNDLTQWYVRNGHTGTFYCYDTNAWIVPERDKFALHHNMKRLAVIDKDDTVTFVWKHPLDVSDCLRLSRFAQVEVYLDRNRHRNKQQATRVQAQRTDNRWSGRSVPSVPYTPGLQVNNKKQLLNPEIAVDKVRRTNRGKAKREWEKVLPLVKLVQAMIRLEAFHITYPQRGELRWNEFTELDTRLEPTSDNAHWFIRVCLGRGYYYTNDVYSQEQLQHAFKRGVSALRKIVNKRKGVYKYVTIAKES